MKPEHVVSAESGGDSVAAVLGETTQPAYQLSADGDITWWNEQFASVVGYTDEELSQLDAPDLFSTDAWDRFEARLTGSDETTYWTDKIDMVRKDGEQCTHHHTTSLSRNGDGETLTGIVSVADEDLPRAELLKTVQLATDRVIAAKTREEIEHALCETLGNAGPSGSARSATDGSKRLQRRARRRCRSMRSPVSGRAPTRRDRRW